MKDKSYIVLKIILIIMIIIFCFLCLWAIGLAKLNYINIINSLISFILIVVITIITILLFKKIITTIFKKDIIYINYKKKMNKLYNKGYCPLIQRSCDYEYCEFWNNNTKNCGLKK